MGDNNEKEVLKAYDKYLAYFFHFFVCCGVLDKLAILSSFSTIGISCFLILLITLEEDPIGDNGDADDDDVEEDDDDDEVSIKHGNSSRRRNIVLLVRLAKL